MANLVAKLIEKSARKIHLFDALIQSKLRYSVASAWLLKADLRRLDGFQARCVRQILKIPCSYFSRVSNSNVLKQGCLQQFSSTVRAMQLNLLGQVLIKPQKKVLKESAFQGDTLV